MTRLIVGTRGSRLALTQTRWVCARLCDANPSLTIEEKIIKTHGDVAVDRPFDASWPVGSFVTALEQALLEGDIDFAVHSYKDLPSQSPPELVIAAVPGREAVQDVLVVSEPMDLDNPPKGLRIGTSSPRRTAQLKRLGDVEIVPIRGNVPTRLQKIEGDDLDAVVLAAAGLRRMSIEPETLLESGDDGQSIGYVENNLYSTGRLMVWRPRREGETITFAVPIAEAGKYAVDLCAAKAGRSGGFRAELSNLDGSKVEREDGDRIIDLKSPGRTVLRRIGYKPVDLDAGQYLLQLTFTGEPGQEIGIDYIWIQKR